MPPSPAIAFPVVHEGQELTYADLQKEAAAAIEAGGYSQKEIADLLGVSPSWISRALNEEPGAKYAAIQRRIIERLTDYAVADEPLFRVRRKGDSA